MKMAETSLKLKEGRGEVTKIAKGGRNEIVKVASSPFLVSAI